MPDLVKAGRTSAEVNKCVATGLSRKRTEAGLDIMQDGEKNSIYLGSQGQYFCAGSLGEDVGL